MRFDITRIASSALNRAMITNSGSAVAASISQRSDQARKLGVIPHSSLTTTCLKRPAGIPKLSKADAS
jgi:hypothetical protein